MNTVANSKEVLLMMKALGRVDDVDSIINKKITSED